MFIAGIILLICLLGVCFRMGGGSNYAPMKLGSQAGRLLRIVPIAVSVAAFYPNPEIIALITFVMGMVGIILIGHGAHMVMGQGTTFTKDARTEIITRWLPVYNETTPMWKRFLIDFIGMSFIYLVRFALIALPLAYFNIFALFALLGCFIPSLAYTLGWYGTKNIFEPTQVGEYGSGMAYGSFILTAANFLAI